MDRAWKTPASMSKPLRQSRGLRAREKPVQGMPTLEGLVVAVKGRTCHESAQNASPLLKRGEK